MRRMLLNLMTVLTLALLPVVTLGSTVYADCGTPSASKDQVLAGIGQAGGNCDSSGVTNALNAAVQILSLVVGIAAVIMIMVGGFKYITSGGESGKVANAKSTLIYALIGLAVAALAQLLVHFVLFQTTNASG